jgi:poly(3-hydroxybutyrate) depolymerase
LRDPLFWNEHFSLGKGSEDGVVPGAAVLSPRGRVLEGGANRWFRRLGEGVFDVDDVIARAGELAAFVLAAREHYGLESRTLIATGFSNGANIALATALLPPDVLTRVAAFSGMYPFGDREPQVSADGVELLLLNGNQDPMAPAASALAPLHGLPVAVKDQRLRSVKTSTKWLRPTAPSPISLGKIRTPSGVLFYLAYRACSFSEFA